MHWRRICHLNDIFFSCYLIYWTVQTMYHHSHIRTFYDVLLRWQTDTGYKSLGSLLFHPPTGNVRVSPTASQNIQNFINHMVCFRTTSVLMPGMSQVSLPNCKPLSWESWKEMEIPQVLWKLCQWLSTQIFIEVREKAVPLKNVN